MFIVVEVKFKMYIKAMHKISHQFGTVASKTLPLSEFATTSKGQYGS